MHVCIQTKFILVHKANQQSELLLALITLQRSESIITWYMGKIGGRKHKRDRDTPQATGAELQMWLCIQISPLCCVGRFCKLFYCWWDFVWSISYLCLALCYCCVYLQIYIGVGIVLISPIRSWSAADIQRGKSDWWLAGLKQGGIAIYPLFCLRSICNVRISPKTSDTFEGRNWIGSV